MGIIADIASIPLSIIQQRQNAKLQRENVNKTIEANKNLAEYQYNRDVEMWNKQNEYNSPLSQMARFKSAGLNPNLIYSQGSAGNATTLPKYQAPTVKYDNIPKTNLPETLSRFQDFNMRQAQIDNVKADTQNKTMQWVIQGLNRDWLYDRNDKQLGNLGYWHNKMVQETNKTQLGLYNQQYRKKQLDAFDQLLTNTIEQGKANIGLRSAQTYGQGITNQYMESTKLVDMLSKILGVSVPIFRKSKK